MIHFSIPELGLTIYDREETYSTNKHLGSFFYWEFVSLVSNILVVYILLLVWETFKVRELILPLISNLLFL